MRAAAAEAARSSWSARRVGSGTASRRWAAGRIDAAREPALAAWPGRTEAGRWPPPGGKAAAACSHLQAHTHTDVNG